nr:MAG TPA: hypothetical protein [Bacteriophage sp.]
MRACIADLFAVLALLAYHINGRLSPRTAPGRFLSDSALIVK